MKMGIITAAAATGILVFAITAAHADAIKVKINFATAAEIDAGLLGIGPKKAKAIVEWRGSKGYFRNETDLDAVPGIGPKTLEQNRDRIDYEIPETPKPAEQKPAESKPAEQKPESTEEPKS